MRLLLTLLLVGIASQAFPKDLTQNLNAFECVDSDGAFPILLKEKNTRIWELVPTLGEEAVKVVKIDGDTFAFPQQNFNQTFLKRKNGEWSLISVNQGEITTVKCEDKNKFVELAIRKLITEYEKESAE